MTDTKFRIVHDAISPTPDVVTEAELREMLDDLYGEDPSDERGWRNVIETLEIREDGVDAVIDGSVALIAEPALTWTLEFFNGAYMPDYAPDYATEFATREAAEAEARRVFQSLSEGGDNPGRYTAIIRDTETDRDYAIGW